MPRTNNTIKNAISMPLVDVYYICQMVGGTLGGMGFERNIEDFMGDMACSRLLRDYPKFTPLHEYIEEIVSSVIWEEYETDPNLLLNEHNFQRDKKLWVDHLLNAHGFQSSLQKWAKHTPDEISIENYLSHLQQEDMLPELLERVAKEVFHILFTNRKVLRNFGEIASFYVRETAQNLYPEKFNAVGNLKRARIPKWAKDGGCPEFCVNGIR